MSGRTVAIVVNLGTPTSTVKAVRSLATALTRRAEVIVVDNGSDDDSLQQFERLADVTVIALPKNDGFSAGCNAGVRAALSNGATRLFFLNSDAEVAPDAVGLLETALDQNPTLGIAGPAVMEAGRPGRVESLGLSYNATTGRMWNIGSGASEKSTISIAPVAGVTGCAMLIRREVFDAVGLFAEEYFFGLEDLDFCLRAERAGWASACVPAATVLHEGGASIGAKSPRRLYFAARNHLLLARRTSPDAGRVVVAFRTASIIALNVAHAVRAPGASLWVRLAAVARGTRDYFAGRFGPDEESSRKQGK